MASVAPESLTIVRSDLNPCTVELTVTCSSDQVAHGFQRALKKLGKEVRVPGFRPGMAPAKMVELALHPEALHNEAADIIVRPAFEVAVRESGLTPHGTPRISMVEFTRDPGVCVFTVKVGLEPMVTLGEYKGIAATRPAVEVSDAEVERHIDEFRRRGGKKQPVKGRGAQEGDMAVVNIKPEGKEAGNFMVVVGQSFGSLDKALTGLEAEGIKAAKLSFPDDFQQKEWAGQSLECTVTVRSLTEVSAADATDDFAKTLNAEGMDDLRAQVRAGLTHVKAEAAHEMVVEQLLQKLMETSDVHVADTTWEEVAERRIEEMADELRNQGTSLDVYVENQGMTMEQFFTAQHEEARIQVKRAVIVERIFRDEGLQITVEDTNRQFLRVAQENRVPQDQLDRFAKEYGPQMRDELIFRAMFAVVTQFLVDNAQVVETEAAKEAPAPKKAKAKKKAE